MGNRLRQNLNREWAKANLLQQGFGPRLSWSSLSAAPAMTPLRHAQTSPERRQEMGSVFKRGRIYYIQYYRNGKRFKESSNCDKKEVARRLLKSREGEIAQGKMPSICFDRVLFDELVHDYLRDYQINNKQTMAKAERCTRYLMAEFGGMCASKITSSHVNGYIEKRLNQGRANATINRELSALKRMFNLAARHTPPKVAQVPYVQMLKENNVRKDFFEDEEFFALREALPEHLRPVVTFAYHSGWRKEEILGLEWKQVDLNEGEARLAPGDTKNTEGRTLCMEPELLEMMRDLRRQRRLDCPYVFHCNGSRIKDFRGAWKRACREIGMPDMWFHDLRRTAVRRMVRAGIPERVAMAISGHKTRAVFDRYNIVSKGDLKAAAGKLEAMRVGQQGQRSWSQFGPSRVGKAKKVVAFYAGSD
jgi:integrase